MYMRLKRPAVDFEKANVISIIPEIIARASIKDKGKVQLDFGRQTSIQNSIIVISESVVESVFVVGSKAW